MAIGPNPDPSPAAIASDTSFFGHPRGLATLFFTEMWERFSYYGMRAILILFLTSQIARGGLGFNDSKAGAVYGLYTAMAYLLCLGGGWVADRITGQRRAVLFGGLLISAGEFCLMVPSESSFYLGLVLLMSGTGMLKGNVSTIVGQLYAKGDLRRDSGFSIYYMGINLGALISPLICGYVGERISWRMGFGVAGVGMLIGVIQFMLGSRHLGTAGLYPASTGDAELDRRQKRNAAYAVAGGLGFFALLGLLGAVGVIEFTPTLLSDGLGWFLLVVSILVFSWLIFGSGWSHEERKRSAAILVLFVASALFWASFEQAGSSLSLFAERSTDRHIFGFEFPASWFQFVQPIFVVAFAPVFGWIWLALARKHAEPSAPAKFTLGLLFAGLAFAILVPPAKMVMANESAQVAMWWLTGTYFLQTLGELLLSPVGLSAMSRLAPDRAGGFVMGIWFLSTSIGNWLAGKAASLYSSFPLPTLFGAVAVSTIGAAVVLAVLVKPTVRLMSGAK
ncbi:MAG TPA: peptide MFS transporter [Bryobacteraceae bacterium]|jgi:POT family proton-dependent oligopeptide transporter